MPLIVTTPLAAFLLAVSSVRARRSAANLALLGAVVMTLATLVAGYGLARRSAPYVVTYSYINVSVAYSGPSNFQSFVVNLVLHVDHLTVAALLAVEICAIGVLAWHQVMGKGEAGPARFNALVSGLLFGCAGVLVSWDLAELVAFWGIAAVMTYLLLAQRWGSDDAARRARIVLALPFLTDLSLLCGVAWLYARYGAQRLDNLLPILHTTHGWTVRALVVGSVLLFIGLAARLAIWPFSGWITRTAISAPPAASALAQAAWSVLAVVVLYRVAPIFAASDQHALQALTYGLAGAAVAGPLLSLLGNEPRRVMALVGGGVAAAGAAIVLHGFQDHHFTFAAAGIACVLAVAPARVAGVLAASAAAGAMRTDDLADMGEGWQRMRSSSLALLATALVLGLGATGALAFGVSGQSWLGVLLGVAVLLVSVGGMRVFLAASIGSLRRRRAFEPERVTEAASDSLAWPLLLALGGAILVVASLIRGWLDFLDGYHHVAPQPVGFALWAAVALAGFALTAVTYARAKDGALRISGLAGLWLTASYSTVAAAVDRFLVAPATDLAQRLDSWIPEGDGELGRFATEAGRVGLAGLRTPALAVVLVLVVVLALFAGLFAPGVVR